MTPWGLSGIQPFGASSIQPFGATFLLVPRIWEIVILETFNFGFELFKFCDVPEDYSI